MVQRSARFAGHCFRTKDQVISDLLLWRLHCPRRGNRPLTYPDTLARGTGLILNELAQAMANRVLWCDIVPAISTAVDWWWWYYLILLVSSVFHTIYFQTQKYQRLFKLKSNERKEIGGPRVRLGILYTMCQKKIPSFLTYFTKSVTKE